MNRIKFRSNQIGSWATSSRIKSVHPNNINLGILEACLPTSGTIIKTFIPISSCSFRNPIYGDFIHGSPSLKAIPFFAKILLD